MGDSMNPVIGMKRSTRAVLLLGAMGALYSQAPCTAGPMNRTWKKTLRLMDVNGMSPLTYGIIWVIMGDIWIWYRLQTTYTKWDAHPRRVGKGWDRRVTPFQPFTVVPGRFFLSFSYLFRVPSFQSLRVTMRGGEVTNRRTEWQGGTHGVDLYWSEKRPIPIGSMYAIYGNIYHQYTPNVSIYTIHGSYIDKLIQIHPTRQNGSDDRHESRQRPSKSFQPSPRDTYAVSGECDEITETGRE